ncbi:M15 family metallopeptidase [Microbacterium sp. LRZ72]|uniref:M15 family metallopeptidase n=1 Tax=Microbacterium sp. LRZ72 TaxID=2942481 RepID=UPI0029A536B4|nr:M15 family metallopeptidase [Microbacterium sp. LRZ72]MDX2377485.1 M15 family metallopeptidase [Microbacterium sp. LRZ72]
MHDLRDPDRIWLGVNKTHPLDPIDAVPYDWTVPQGTRNAANVFVRPDVTDSLADMSAGVAATGLGEMGLQSGFRGYAVQQRIHAQQVAALGRDAGEELAARPGYSEHQTGLAVDVFACTPGCGPIDAFGDTAVGEWVAENAWRYGWIVRYEEGRTDVTGYVPEAWHLRYIGPQLAEAYHEGGYDTLEQFFGLAPAPDYPD